MTGRLRRLPLLSGVRNVGAAFLGLAGEKQKKLGKVAVNGPQAIEVSGISALLSMMPSINDPTSNLLPQNIPHWREIDGQENSAACTRHRQHYGGSSKAHR
jgi:hypothetical protein